MCSGYYNSPVLRQLLTYLSRGRILKRNLPADFGSRPIYVSPDAALAFWKMDLEKVDPILFNFARHLVKPGNVVWDVGANVGLFTFAAAAIAGKNGSVLAIEPDSFLAGLIQRSAQLPSLDAATVHVISFAISDRPGVVTFNISKRGRCSNHVSGFGTEQSGGARSSISVPSVNLDSLIDVYGPPNVVKIDIEGMDHIALRGADKLLRRRPILILEVTDANRDEMFEILQKYGYRVFDTTLRPVRKMPLCNLVAMADGATVPL